MIQTIREFEGQAVAARTLAYLRKIDPWVFEELVLTCLEEGGAAIWRNASYSRDGGIDGHVHLPGVGWSALQCKRYVGHVCRADVLEFYELLYRRGFSKGLFVHSGRTSENLRGVLRDSRVILCSGENLAQLVRAASLPC